MTTLASPVPASAPRLLIAAEDATVITVALVDDDPVTLALLAQVVSRLPMCRTVAFADPREALAWCAGGGADVIITDCHMPGMDGIALLGALRAEPATAEVPIMVITTDDDKAVRYDALFRGANDFLTKPIDGVEVRARVQNMMNLRLAQRFHAEQERILQREVRRATRLLREREQEIILRLTRAAEHRDNETGAHIMRIAHVARLLAEELGFDAERQEALFLAAPMHDIGKIGVPDSILRKAGRLTAEEMLVMRTHTTIGHTILSGSNVPLLSLAAAIALTHHERVDGTGYPRGLAGDAIPVEGRIVAVADVFDALTSARPYKAAWAPEEALRYVVQGRGSAFDAACVTALERRFADVLALRSQFADEPAPPPDLT